MRRLAIGIFLLGIASFFVALEIYKRPETFDRAITPPTISLDKTGSKSPLLENKETPTTSPAQTNEPEKNELPKAEDFFSTAALREANVTIGPGRYSPALFRHVPVDVNRDSFSLVTFPFSIDGKAIGTVSRLIPAEEMSSGRLMALIRKKLDSVVTNRNSPDMTLTEPLKTVGEANFYLNDRLSFPNTNFLITRSDGKVLAFQYSSEYHGQVKNVIPLFFK